MGNVDFRFEEKDDKRTFVSIPYMGNVGAMRMFMSIALGVVVSIPYMGNVAIAVKSTWAAL